MEDAEIRRKERREERKREMEFQLSAQRRAMNLAELAHPVAAEILPSSSSNSDAIFSQLERISVDLPIGDDEPIGGRIRPDTYLQRIRMVGADIIPPEIPFGGRICPDTYPH